MAPSAELSSELLDLALMAADSFWNAKQLTPARRAYMLALDLDAHNVHALNRMARIALTLRQDAEAQEWLEQAEKLKSDPATWVNLAAACFRNKQFGAALHWCGMATGDNTEPFQPAWLHKAAMLEELEPTYRDAECTALEALTLFPGDPELLYALSTYQLARGDFENGWLNYENRAPRLDLLNKLDEYPEWQGESLEHSTILVCGEQGLGDKIMFARYVPLLVELGADVVLYTTPELARLFAESLYGHDLRIRIVTSDRELDAIAKDLDYWVAICSLPFKLRVAVGVDCRPCLYLKPFPADVERFAKLVPKTGTLNVGLCWKGAAQHRRDQHRSISWEQMRPLTEVPGCRFYSLQQGDVESGLLNLTRYAHDMADTAAAIANLDLVITVDTAVLHLAGAMKANVWGLLGSPTDWRWGQEGTTTPWYESATLIRKCGDWRTTINAAAEALDRFRLKAVSDPGRLREPAYLDKGIETRDCRYGKMSWYRNDAYIGRALQEYGEYSESEVDLFRQILKPGDRVVEAGANIGALTVALADIVGPEGQVLAFEPQPRYVALASQNLAGSRHAFVHRMALGAECTSLTLRHVPLDVVHAPGWESTGAEFAVPQTRLDSLNLKRLDLIKIDVDGQEFEILRGAVQTIDRCRPFIYVENDKPEKYPGMLVWLVERNYRLYQHHAPLYNPNNWLGNSVNVFGSVVSGMVLAVPNERKGIHFEGLERIRAERN